MKFFRCIITALLLLFFINCYAQEKAVSPMDSVDISLLTCSPHDEIYSLYGHTALRVEDKRAGKSISVLSQILRMPLYMEDESMYKDIAINYGMFSFDKPFFVLRFVFGITDYEMGIEPFSMFVEQYRRYGCSITQQKINLTAKEKQAIIDALATNYLPENRVYRYNYFYNNCTTKARDMIVNNINGKVSYGPEPFRGMSFRANIHSCNEEHPWARLGNDLLLGADADRFTTYSEHQFLPANAMEDFDEAIITCKDGTTKPLVTEKTVVLEAGQQAIKSEFPLRPRTCTLILLLITIAVTIAEKITHKTFWGYDAMLMTATGIAGVILFLMLFSQHPTVRFNLQILLLNPLQLFFVWRMIKRTRKHIKDKQYKYWIIIICLFFAGTFFQLYAEGMCFLALSVLIRNIAGLYRPINIKTKQ